MLSARVIPCLDVDNGRVVKGIKFKELRDAGDPVLVAQAYEEQGADELVFLDITASSDERNTMRDVVEKTAATCFPPTGSMSTAQAERRFRGILTLVPRAC